MDKAAGLATNLLKSYKKQIEALTIVPSDGGVFEVTIDGKLAFSKKACGRFPEEDEIKQAIG